MIRFYRVTSQVGFFEEYNTLVIASSALAIAAEVHLSGFVNYSAGDYMSIEGRHLDMHFRIPIVGPVAAALANRKPDIIELTAVDGRGTSDPHAHSSQGFVSLLGAMYQPFLVNYFERFRPAIENAFSSDRTKWPDSWQMGWAARNSASHGGNVHFMRQGQQPVRWRGLTISPANHGQPLVGQLLSAGDLLMMMVDMEEAIGNSIAWDTRSVLDQ